MQQIQAKCNKYKQNAIKCKKIARKVRNECKKNARKVRNECKKMRDKCTKNAIYIYILNTHRQQGTDTHMDAETCRNTRGLTGRLTETETETERGIQIETETQAHRHTGTQAYKDTYTHIEQYLIFNGISISTNFQTLILK